MSNRIEPKLPKWPFFLLGDAALLGLAWFIYAQSKPPMGHWQAALFLFSGALGAVIAITPFVLEYRAAVKMVETGVFVSTVSQIQNLDLLARQIGNATAQWQGVQELSSGSVAAAKDIAERMTAETAAFTEFMKNPQAIQTWLPKAEGLFKADPNYRLSKRDKKHRFMLKLEQWFGFRFNKKHYRRVR